MRAGREFFRPLACHKRKKALPNLGQGLPEDSPQKMLSTEA
jgi:hypothetical protein